jgi:NAD(P)-dependent dehydrogenase (short-subunit alcohol dehydrogenase family)
MSSNDSTGRIAVVTGANRGMGFEACRQLGKLGFRVVLTARDPEKGEEAARALRDEGLEVVAHTHDVNDPQSAENLASFVESEYGEVHVLVNNAGEFFDIEEGDSASILATSKEALTRSFETNTIGAVLTAQALVPLMKKTGHGRIVNVSSGMGGITEMNGGYPGYRLSKAALNASTRVLSEELKDDNIKVNALCPGWVRTDMGGEDAHLSPEEGVDTTVYLSTLPDDGPTGTFFRKRAPILW